MTAPQRLEHDLPQLLAQLADGTRPDYRDSLVEAVGRTRQRPAWAFPGRWLPMDMTVQRVRPAPVLRVPIALIVVVALVAAALVALAVASRPHVPAPFGPARNGAIVYGSNGDLYLLASEGVEPRLLVGGAQDDRDPAFSPQGDRILFMRHEDDGTSLFVVRPDGSGLRQLLGPTVGLDQAAWSPDGTRIAITHRPGGMEVISIVDVATGGLHRLEIPGSAEAPILWRPGHDDELTFRATTDDGHHELHIVNVVTGDIVRLDVPAERGAALDFDAQRANWSPDGRRLVLEVGSGMIHDGPMPRIYLKLVEVADDGTVESITPFVHDPSADYEYLGTFTPDGTGLLFASQRGCEFQAWMAPLDDPAAATAVGEPTSPGACGTSGIVAFISPDGQRILTTKGDGVSEDRMILGDRTSGSAESMYLTTNGQVTWQRLAP